MSAERHETLEFIESSLFEPLDPESLGKPLSPERAAAAIALLESLLHDGDPEEQRETGEYRMRALDEDRPPDQKLFPWLR